MDKKHRGHPYISELKDLYLQRKIGRREFMRYAALLGLSVGAINSFLASCTPQAAPAPTAAPGPAAAPTPTPKPAGPIRGGTLRVSTHVMRVDHPARYSWVAPSNILRQVCEYLTFTDKDNITHPYLLEKWEASEDLKTWTLYLRKGIKWNNGDDFVADDVVFTMKQWLDPEVGSSILGLMSYLKPDNIEKVDDYTVRLHLDSPQIAVPEHLFHYPAQVLNHRTFEGDILKAPVGTGPFTLVEYTEGERAVLKRREDYWQKGADGKPLPYLDEIVYVDLGTEITPHISAIQAGEVDQIDFGDLPDLEAYKALKDDPSVKIIGLTTARTQVLRMRVDREPWTDNRVRMALKLCQNREKILKLAYFDEGAVGIDAHVAPVHPEYCEKPIPKYDPEKAKQLLAEAGYPDGLDVELTVGSEWPYCVSYAEVLKEDAAPAGFRIKINLVPGAAYWDVWTEVDLGITPWTHRPLGTMVLALGYICDEEGKPVPWNETRWCDDEFTKLLREAEGILDVEERRKIFCKLEDIQMERGPIGLAYWRNTWAIVSKKFQGIDAHPTQYYFYAKAWYNPEA